MPATSGSNNKAPQQHRPTRYDLKGTSGNDVLQGGEGDDRLDGRSGNDLLTGAGGDDEIRGSVGHDTVDGGAGDDQLEGEEGNDRLVGGDGDDELQGGQGNDLLDGGAGKDELDGGQGADTVSGGGGDDQIEGGQGDDLLDGGAGKDKINGGEGKDTIYGGDGDDRIEGDAGDDWIAGGAGDDRIEGGAGSDHISAGAGSDRVDGQAGNDTVVYIVRENLGSNEDRYLGGSGSDTLRLELTREDWLREEIQADIAGYRAFLESFASHHGAAYRFRAFGLRVAEFERLQISVDGVVLSPGDDPVGANDDAFTGETENSLIAGNLTANDEVPDLLRGVTLLSQPVGGTLAVDTDGSFTFDPGQDFDSLAAGESATISFDYQATDADGDTDTAAVRLTLTGSNDAPVFTGGDTAGAVAEDDLLTISGQLSAVDVDHNASLTWSMAGSASGAYGSIALDATGQWTYTLANNSAAVQSLAAGEPHAETFAIQVTDEHGVAATQEVTVVVTGTNDAPSLTTDAYRLVQGSTTVLDVLINDTDIEGESLTIVAVQESRLGSVSITADGQRLEYTPTSSGVDFVTYTVRDEVGGTSVATAVIVVGPAGGTAVTIAGGPGDEVIDQSTATEDLVITGGPGVDQILAGSGNDLVLWTAGDGDDTIDGGAGFDHVAVALSETQASTVEVTEVDGNVVITGPDFTLTLDGIEELSFVGSPAGSTILLGDLSNTDIADDTVVFDGAAGTDSVSGGAFFPRRLELYGNGGNDTLTGGLKGDLLDGGDGADVLTGNYGADVLRGGAGGDILDGGQDWDNLDGGAGNDRLDGGTGGDVLAGGSGDDIFVYDQRDGSLDGGSGRDTLRVEGGGITLDLGAPGGPATQNIEVVDLAGTGGNTLRLDANSVIAVTDEANTLRVLGNAGDQVFAYGAWVKGASFTDGGATFDTYTSGGARLEIQSEVSATVPQPISSPKQLLEELKAQTGGVVTEETVRLAASQLDPNAYVDPSGELMGNILRGGDHILPYYEQPQIPTDQVLAGFGLPPNRATPIVDALLNGPPPATESIAAIVKRRTGTDITNNPVYQVAAKVEGAAAGHPTVEKVQAGLFLVAWADELLWDATRPVPGESITWTQGTSGYRVDGTSGDDTILTTSGDLTRDDTIDGSRGNDRIYGGDGYDDVFGGDGNDNLFGGAGDDYLDGSSGNDYLEGGDGDDRLDGGAGTNRLEGGVGNDVLTGFGGADGMLGGSGSDTVSSGGGVDYVHGGTGNDYLDAGAGNDDVFGGFGNDVLWGGEGNDTLYGDEDTEQLPHSAQFPGSNADSWDGNDVLNGGGGNDLLIGGGGADGMSGWAGDDTLDGTDARYLPNGTEIIGNAGDFMSGGQGHDTYIVSATDDIVQEGIWRQIDGEHVLLSIEREGFNLGLGGYATEAQEARGNPWFLASSGATTPYLSFDLSRLPAPANGLGGYILSPVMQLNPAARAEPAALRFEYYLDEGAAGDVAVTVEVWNGTSWIRVADNAETAGLTQLQNGGGWHDAAIAIDLSQFSDLSAFQFRFGASSNAGGAYGGFLIDDVEFEAAGGATDLVKSMVTYTLPANVENLILLEENQFGHSTGNLGGTGNDLANWITGNAYDNRIDGRAGADTMVGGLGNDIYVVDDPGDVVADDYGAADRIESSITVASLPVFVEDLTLTGTSAIDGTGSADNNILIGNAAANALSGLAGDDTIQAGGGDDVLRGGDGSDALDGGAGSDGLQGGDGSDVLDGGAGLDTLTGGTGDDTYVVGHETTGSTTTFDAVTEIAAGGTDKVRLAATTGAEYALADHVENLELTSAGAARGNDLANAITGSAGNDVLAGGPGNDTVRGGAGSDRLTGGEGTDGLYGDAGDDTLVYDGTDALTGGDGNDTYEAQGVVVDATKIIETTTGGTGDRVISSGSFDLNSLSNIENLLIAGTGESDTSAYTGTGTAANNLLETAAGSFSARLEGGAGNDTLAGGNNGDRLVGGAGLDLLLGYGIATASGANADTEYVVDAVADLANGRIGVQDQIKEYEQRGPGAGVDGGTDTLELDGSAITIGGLTFDAGVDSPYVESYRFDHFSVSFTARGTWRDDVLDASTVAGNVKLYGGGNGDDRLVGGLGDDVLDGQRGADTLAGGLGDDTYYVYSEFDEAVVEAADGGIDTVFAQRSYTLSANVENLILTGLSQFRATGNTLNNVITGDAGDNRLDGGAGNDTLYGGEGRDELTGGAGADRLVGGTGDDHYVVDAFDTYVEAVGEGYDSVASVQGVVLSAGAEIERVDLLGNGAINATGNEFNNDLFGNDGNNRLDAGGGQYNILYGGKGNDTLVVRHYTDIVVDSAGEGTDTVEAPFSFTLPSVYYPGGQRNWTTSEELENLRLLPGAYAGTGNELNNIIWGNDQGNLLDGGAGFDLLLGGGGNDTYIVRGYSSLADESAFDQYGNRLLLLNSSGQPVRDIYGDLVFQDAGGYADHVRLQLANPQSADRYYLPDYIEDLTLETADWSGQLIGNEADNTIRGGSITGNLIDGGVGADRLFGGSGNDTFYVDNVGDQVSGGFGQDRIHATVSYILPFDVDSLYLGGTANINASGNGSANEIRGNSGNNILDGGASGDTLYGTGGADTYVVDNISDVVIEAFWDWQVDTVQAYIPAFSLTGTYVGNVENLSFMAGAANHGEGNSRNNVITGNTGNDTLSGAAGDDTLVGNAGNDILDGGIGNDRMEGGAGDDTYHVDTTGDQVVEVAGDGVDTVHSALTVSLAGTAVENVTLTGTANTNGTGNEDANTLIGNTGANLLSGGGGNDLLQGGAGADTLAGGEGKDLLDGGTGVDSVDGGEGNDTLVYDAADQLRGGFGHDTLRVDGPDATIDLTEADTAGRLEQLEEIVFTGSGANAVVLNAESVVALASGVLRIRGSAQDKVTAEGDWRLLWTATDGNGDTFHVYEDGVGRIEVLDGVEVRIIDTPVPVLSVADLNGSNGFRLWSNPALNPTDGGDGEGYGPGAGGGSGDPDHFGASVAFAGDLNGDGFDDLIVGAPYTNITSRYGWRSTSTFVEGEPVGPYEYHNRGEDLDEGAGAAYIIFGKPGGFAAAEVHALTSGDGMVVRADGLIEVYNGQYTNPDTGDPFAQWSYDGAPVQLAGASVAAAGDVNGDGFADVLIGAPQAGNSYETDPSPYNTLFGRQGASYVVFGTNGSLSASIGGRALDGANGFNLMTEGVGTWNGYAVASAGDFNGDGFGDVVVGAPYAFGNTDRDGKVFVVFGSGAGIDPTVDVTALDGTDGFLFTANENYVARLGSVLSSAGDLNGDGFGDLLVDDLGTASRYVLFGNAAGPGPHLDAADLDGRNGFELYTFETNWQGGLAAGVAGGGDVNGDGFDDLVLGTNSSGAFVLFGAGDMTHVAGLDSGYGQSSDVWALDSEYGGDGTYGYHLTGPEGNPDEGGEGGGGGGGTGRTVAIAGDINGDGYDDLLIGAPYATGDYKADVGAVYVVFGSDDVVAANISLADLDGINGFRIVGDTAAGRLGSSLAGAGDLNGDGFDDIIVGAKGGESEGYFDESNFTMFEGGIADGSAYVIFGKDFAGTAGTMGTPGSDTLAASGAGAVVRAGGGNDVIEVSSADFFRIDGGDQPDVLRYDGTAPLDKTGTGFDTLALTGTGVHLDFSSLQANAVENIEVIDLGTGGNSIAVTPRQAAAISGSNLLQIDGTAGSVTLLAGATVVSSGGYNIHSYGGVHIRVAATLTVTTVNVAPDIFSPSSFSLAENETEVTTLRAADDNGDTLTYEIAGGADAARFSIDAAGGLRFIGAPDYEARGDVGGNNVYDVVVEVNDGYGRSAQQALAVTVTDANEAPVFTTVTAWSLLEGNQLGLVGYVAAVDEDGDAVTYSIVGGADADDLRIRDTFGQLFFNSTPNFSFPTDADGNNVYEVVIQAADPSGATSTQSVTVTVININESPSYASPYPAVTVVENTTDVGLFAAGDRDNEPLTYSIAGGADAGKFSVDAATGAVRFIDAPDFDAPGDADGDNVYNVQVRATDAARAYAQANLTVTVTNVADGPVVVAVADAYTTSEDAALTAALAQSLLANDGGGSSLRVNTTPVIAPSHGTVALNSNGTFTYTPVANFNGTDSFTYQVSNPDGTSQGTATVTVTPVNDAPTAAADSFSTAEETSVSGNLLGNDSDIEGDSLTISTTPTTVASHGTVTLSANGSFTYMPAANFSGSDSFTYTVQDVHGATSQATATVVVTPVNDAPTGVADSFTTAEDTALSGNLLTNDSDIDGDSLSLVTTPVIAPSHGAVALNGNGTFTYTPASNYSGADSFTYQLSDGKGGTAQATATVTVTPVNDAPTVALTDTAQVVNGSFETPDLNGGSFGTFGPGASLAGWTVGGHSVDLVGSFWQASEGDQSVDLSGNAAGSVQQVLQTVPGTQYTVTFAFSGSPLDPGASDMRVSAGATAQNYSFGAANSGSAMGWRAETFIFTATSTSTTLVFASLEGSSNGPVLDNVRIAPSGFVVAEDSAVTLTGLSVADVDADSNAVQLSLAVAHGDLTLANTTGLTLVDGNGTDGTLTVSGPVAALNAALASGLTYTPDANYNGADALNITVDDQGNGGAGGAQTTTQSIALAVTAVNDAPTLGFSESVAVANGSFETPEVNTGWITYSTPFDGWTVTKGSVDVIGAWQAAAGNQSVDMNGNSPGRIQQTIDTVAGATYRVTFNLSKNSGLPGTPATIVVLAGDESQSYTFTETTSNSDMRWAERTFEFTADGASTNLIFDAISPGGGSGPALDNVRVISSDSFFTAEDTTKVLRGLSVADLDAGAGSVQLSLAVAHGDLSLASTTGLTLVDGNGTDGTLVVSGTVANLNAALSVGLGYTPDANYNGADTLSVAVSDQGSSGAGGAQSASESIAIGVTPVTDTYAISTVTALLNGSFETPAVPTGWFSTYGVGANLGGWTVTKNSIDVVGTLWAAADGIQSVDMNGNDAGRIEQAIATITNADYRVSFELWSSGTLRVSAGDESGTFTTASGSAWTEHSFDFTADGASTNLVFDAISPGGPGGAVLDHVEIVRVLEDFTLGAGGDVLDFSGLLSSVGAPHNSTAFSSGWLDFEYNAATGNTDVRFDANGGGDEYVPILTLVGTTLTESDTAHYQL